MKVWQCSKHRTKLPLYWLRRIDLFSDGEDIVMPCIHKITTWVGKRTEIKVNEIALSKQTITRHIEELSYDVSEQQMVSTHAHSLHWPWTNLLTYVM